MGWLVEQIGCIGDLDDLAQIHHSHPVADVVHHVQGVGDEDEGEAELLLNLLQQVQHLSLHRDVEGAGWLVEEDELGVK